MYLLYRTTHAGPVVSHDYKEVLSNEAHLLKSEHYIHVRETLPVRAYFIQGNRVLIRTLELYKMEEIG